MEIFKKFPCFLCFGVKIVRISKFLGKIFKICANLRKNCQNFAQIWVKLSKFVFYWTGGFYQTGGFLSDGRLLLDGRVSLYRRVLSNRRVLLDGRVLSDRRLLLHGRVLLNRRVSSESFSR